MIVRYLLLGITQGLTEFLPVSSSAHLVIAEKLLGIDPPGVLLEAILHLGTLLAVVYVFRQDLWQIASRSATEAGARERKELGLLALGTVPIAVLGILLEKQVETAFSSLLTVGICLQITGLFLLVAHWASKRATREDVGFMDAILIGISQAAALLPGISRSGATISCGIIRRIRGERAARFSFLLSVPAITGASAMQLVGAVRTPGVYAEHWVGLIVGALAAAIVGAIAIKTLLAVISRGRLGLFAIYCILLGLVLLLS